MIQLRPSAARGRTKLDWLDSRHTFSFGDYHDPARMGFRSLRVLNEDWIAPGAEFPMHGHRDMEILTIVLDGALAHRDSLGNGSVIRPGELQRMSAGTGIMHAEANPSATEPVHLLQIWLLPDRRGHEPGYEQRAFPAEETAHHLRPVATPDGREGSLTIHQDAALFLAMIGPGQHVLHRLRPGRHAWVQVARGVVTIDDATLAAGDGAAISDEETVQVDGVEAAEILLFDLA
jgi:redox-sensitive bicupin YhaK (pirin superfamily)